MFYLKYRPRKIADVDNIKARNIISQILQSKEIPHAFLFVGQKGTGKTSVARIFAKAVNCLNNKGKIDPCNKCHNCLSIDLSSSPDVIELDAASNRGINEIKNLIRESSFLPMTCRYRIFIIDEAHMITTDGFNALLKTLEEPPPQVIFILATTNPEKVPKTIASRCLLVNFGKARIEELKIMLKRIASGEKISIDDRLSDLIASHSEKSFRDAAKIFEELVIQNKLDLDLARDYLGLRAKQNLLEIVKDQSLKNSLAWVEEFSQTGGSFKVLLEELLEELHLLLLQKNGVLSEDKAGPDFSLGQITRLIKLFTEAYNSLRMTPVESIPLEIALVEFYNQISS